MAYKIKTITEKNVDELNYTLDFSGEKAYVNLQKIRNTQKISCTFRGIRLVGILSPNKTVMRFSDFSFYCGKYQNGEFSLYVLEKVVTRGTFRKVL